MNEDKIVVYETFTDPINAHIVKGLLESYGIQCFLTDELMATLNIAYCAAIGGVKLHVFEKDVDLIQSILKSKNSDPEPDQSIEGKASDISCPNCHSTNVSYGGSVKKKFGIRFALLFSLISILALIFYPFPMRKTYHCFDCDHEFKKGEGRREKGTRRKEKGKGTSIRSVFLSPFSLFPFSFFPFPFSFILYSLYQCSTLS